MYDVEPHIAEIYDQSETYTDDVELVRNLVDRQGFLRILEPFCGTGRILIPLALDGQNWWGSIRRRECLLVHGRKPTNWQWMHKRESLCLKPM